MHRRQLQLGEHLVLQALCESDVASRRISSNGTRTELQVFSRENTLRPPTLLVLREHLKGNDDTPLLGRATTTRGSSWGTCGTTSSNSRMHGGGCLELHGVAVLHSWRQLYIVDVCSFRLVPCHGRIFMNVSCRHLKGPNRTV
jgi:hypothetical protein